MTYPGYDGCFVGLAPPNQNWYGLEVAADSDLERSQLMIALKCQAGESVRVQVYRNHVENGKVLPHLNAATVVLQSWGMLTAATVVAAAMVAMTAVFVGGTLLE